MRKYLIRCDRCGVASDMGTYEGMFGITSPSAPDGWCKVETDKHGKHDADLCDLCTKQLESIRKKVVIEFLNEMLPARRKK